MVSLVLFALISAQLSYCEESSIGMMLFNHHLWWPRNSGFIIGQQV